MIKRTSQQTERHNQISSCSGFLYNCVPKQMHMWKSFSNPQHGLLSMSSFSQTEIIYSENKLTWV